MNENFDIPQLEKELEHEINKDNILNVFRYFLILLFAGAAIVITIILLKMPLLQVDYSTLSPQLKNGDLILCSSYNNVEEGDYLAFKEKGNIYIELVKSQDQIDRFNNINKKKLLGKVVFKIWPINEIGFIEKSG